MSRTLRTPDRATFLGDMAALVDVESPTADPEGCEAALAVLADLWASRTGRRPQVVVREGRSHLHLPAEGAARVLLLGHVDTVWPAGTLARWPFAVDGDRASGPGVFDMKAGLVMGLHATAAVDDPGVGLLVTTDEEVGSTTSQALVEEVARGVDAVLVLEPSGPGGAVKHVRKGVSLFHARITGRAAHAGLEPHRGVNALVELAAQVPAVMALADPEAGTTVTPTLASAGTTMNTVPAHAEFRIDVRATVAAEQARVREALAGLRATLPGATVEVAHLGSRPPLESGTSADLLALHEAVCAELGVVLPPPMASGGGSDGNLTAGVGVPTLDGLGGVGDGAHAEGEHVMVEPTRRGTGVLVALLQRLLADPPPRPPWAPPRVG